MSLIAEVKMKKINSPWNFDCPSYDERTSCYVDAGWHHGIGHKQSVGSKKHTVKGPIPFGRPNQLEVDEVPRTHLKNDIVE